MATGPLTLDPALLEGWVKARSRARRLAQPYRQSGGWRLDTQGPTERVRYVFAGPTKAFERLAQAIVEPFVLLKVCASSEATGAALPPRWVLGEPRFVMTCQGPMTGGALSPPKGYRLQMSQKDGVSEVEVQTETGERAAGGRAAFSGPAFIYDQIETILAHRRLGLGRLVMKALEAERPVQNQTQILVATKDGRALYETLGWTVVSPYTTAQIPAVAASPASEAGDLVIRGPSGPR